MPPRTRRLAGARDRQGLPIKMLTPDDYQPTKGNIEVLVKKDSSIQNFADLAGKTVATINLQGQFHLGVANAVEKAGGIPTGSGARDEPGRRAGGIAANRIDATVMQDPLLSQAKAYPDVPLAREPLRRHVPYRPRPARSGRRRARSGRSGPAAHVHRRLEGGRHDCDGPDRS